MAKSTVKARRPPSGAEEAPPARGKATLQPAPQREHLIPLTVPSVLRKFTELALMASFLGPVLAYQLSLPVEAFDWVRGQVGQLVSGLDPLPIDRPLALLGNELVPFLAAAIPVLETKTTVWLLIAVILIAVHLCGRVYERLFHEPVYPVDLSAQPGRRDWYRLIPFLCIVGFLLWSVISFNAVGWGPNPPPESLADMPALVLAPAGEGGVLDAIGTAWGKLLGLLMSERASSFHSFVAWVQVAVALLFFLVAEDVIRTRRLVYKLLGLILAMGVIAALFSILVHARLPLLREIWIDWGPQDYRNDVGGFIGHNTAVSSFVMAPFLISWALFMAHRGRVAAWVRALLVFGMVVMAFVLILAQSRAVIPILFVAFVGLLALLARRATLRPGLRFLVGVPLVAFVLLGTQFIDHPYNPLYRRSIPLETRLEHLTTEHLKSETRLRIMVASLPVVRERFLTGTGFGTFHYVYPQAQGEFYQRNPETFIAPTDRKSFHAHNEYLQTLFETGIVGLLLAVGGVVVVLMAGWRALGASIRQRHIAIQVALFVSILAMLAHAFFDFPLRVAPLASLLVLMLAIWSAGDRLWTIPVKPLAERDEGTGASLTPLPLAPEAAREFDRWKPPARPPRKPATARWKAGVLFSAIALLMTYGVVLAGSIGSQWYSAQTLTLLGTKYINRYFTVEAPSPSDRRMELVQAERVLKQASRLQPLLGEPDYHRAHAISVLCGDVAMERQATTEAAEAEQMRAFILRSGEEALRLLNASMREYLFHGTYRQRAAINYLLFLQLDREGIAYLQQALEDLEHAVLMNPGEVETIHQLIRWREIYGVGDERANRRYYRLIYHFHPHYFHGTLLREVAVQRSLFQFEEAYAMSRRLLPVEPTDMELRADFVTSAIWAGRLEEARREIGPLAEAGHPLAPLFEAHLAIRSGNRDAALAVLQQTPARGPEEIRRAHTALRHALRAILAEQRERDAEAEAAWNDLDRVAQATPYEPANIAWMLHVVFNENARARSYLNQRLVDEGHPTQPAEYALQGEILLARHEAALEQLRVLRMKARENNEPLPVLEPGPARQAVEGALNAYQRAREVAVTDLERSILTRRIRELQEVLKKEG